MRSEDNLWKLSLSTKCVLRIGLRIGPYSKDLYLPTILIALMLFFILLVGEPFSINGDTLEDRL